MGALTDALVVSEDGLRHYAVIVEELPAFVTFKNKDLELPFFVAMCDLYDAYDAAKGWYDFEYPATKFKETDVQHGHPTCARCSGA